MNLYPDLYCENITKIDEKVLKDNDIRALILDVDNTLLDFDLKFLEGLKEWYDATIKNNGIKWSVTVSNDIGII